MMPLDNREDEPEEDFSDVRHPDHDLSEWGIAYDRGERPKPWFTRRWVQLLIAGVIVFSLVLPFLQRL